MRSLIQCIALVQKRDRKKSLPPLQPLLPNYQKKVNTYFFLLYSMFL